MNKRDLRTGHIVTLRKGSKYKVFLNASVGFGTSDVLARDSGIIPLANFNEDLEHKADRNMDIIKVECVYAYHLLDKPIGSIEYETIWERKEAKQMTVAEIEAILGYKVEIISDQ